MCSVSLPKLKASASSQAAFSNATTISVTPRASCVREFIQDLGTSRVYLVYQPQHDDQHRVVGVEALMRWQHRHFGLISPGAICLLLEESRQICLLGRWAIATACRQLGDWKLAGIGSLRMSVNLSPLQLKDAGLAPLVTECLRSNQLQAGEFGLELTESQHVPDDRVSVQTLKALQAIGIHLEMDDFGMGYSSMLYIRRFHFDAIKLDGFADARGAAEQQLLRHHRLGGAAGARAQDAGDCRVRRNPRTTAVAGQARLRRVSRLLVQPAVGRQAMLRLPARAIVGRRLID